MNYANNRNKNMTEANREKRRIYEQLLRIKLFNYLINNFEEIGNIYISQ